jgi:hypothetical protein
MIWQRRKEINSDIYFFLPGDMRTVGESKSEPINTICVKILTGKTVTGTETEPVYTSKHEQSSMHT